MKSVCCCLSHDRPIPERTVPVAISIIYAGSRNPVYLVAHLAQTSVLVLIWKKRMCIKCILLYAGDIDAQRSPSWPFAHSFLRQLACALSPSRRVLTGMFRPAVFCGMSACHNMTSPLCERMLAHHHSTIQTQGTGAGEGHSSQRH